jgi:hypothetical protein
MLLSAAAAAAAAAGQGCGLQGPAGQGEVSSQGQQRGVRECNSVWHPNILYRLLAALVSQAW